jgi:hypothetical protein
MSLRRLGISNYHLFWRRQVQAAADTSIATRFLAQFRDDPSAMRDLRSLLMEAAHGLTNTRLNDDQVLIQIAHLMTAGELIVAREWPVHGGNAVQPEVADSADEPEPAPAARSSNSQGPESSTFPPNTNGASQASTLAAAAASGAPFCSH